MRMFPLAQAILDSSSALSRAASYTVFSSRSVQKCPSPVVSCATGRKSSMISSTLSDRAFAKFMLPAFLNRPFRKNPSTLCPGLAT